MSTTFSTLDVFPETLGGRIRKIRSIRAMQQKDLAAKVRVSVLAIKNIENHHAEPKVYTVAQIARALGVTIDYLVFGDTT